MKFTTEGRITVSVKPMPGSLPGMEMLQLSVQDTGCGIPKEKQKFVFDAFGQVRWHLEVYLTCCAATAGRVCHCLASCISAAAACELHCLTCCWHRQYDNPSAAYFQLQPVHCSP